MLKNTIQICGAIYCIFTKPCTFTHKYFTQEHWDHMVLNSTQFIKLNNKITDKSFS